MRENPSMLLVNWPELLYFHRDRLLPSLEGCNGHGIKLRHWAVQIIPQMTDLYSVYCSLHSGDVQAAVHLERDRIYSGWMVACSEEVNCREVATDYA
ncbi:hypothetical protein PHET_06537 [Paragonimus heterotremus]|uniref:Uncharacterized protein n=1 Tax=Paragonimus heterotremus TaxID=100268 RepID=A0A8J4WQA3_9TREM|nr:hypothetical protein PHET_06537 [Paragonimus heterotremus]